MVTRRMSIRGVGAWLRRVCVPVSVLVVCLVACVGCGTAPITGRSQFIMVGDGEMMQLAQQEYTKMTTGDTKVITRGPQYDQVVRVGRRIAAAAEAYSDQSGSPQQFAWEFTLIDDPEMVNAWCMPGGKIAVYTGILKLATTDAELAVVMGHEVAHALARHTSERMSHAMVAQLGTSVLAEALAQNGSQTSQLFAMAAGLGAQYGHMLPFGRAQELEADRIGLILMASAGYDPRVAPGFWRKMSQVKGGANPPEWMSTHPADSRRIQDLEAGMPEAMDVYGRNR